MPAYEYELVAAETGETLAEVTAVVPVAERDGLVVRRVGWGVGWEVFALVREATGEVVARIGGKAGRGSVQVRRRTAPRSVCISGAARNPNDAGRQVVAGYYKLEQQKGSRFRSSFSAEQIQAAHGRRKVDD